MLPGKLSGPDRLPPVAHAVRDDDPDPLAAFDRAYTPIEAIKPRYNADGTAAFCPEASGDSLRTGTEWRPRVFAEPEARAERSTQRYRWAEDSRLLAEVGEFDRVARLRDMTTFRLAVAPVPLPGGSCSPAFDAAGETLYVVGPETVARYRVAGRDVQDRVGWSAEVPGAVAASPDGRTLATFSARPGPISLKLFGPDDPNAPVRSARPELVVTPTGHLTVTATGEAFAAVNVGMHHLRTGDAAPPTNLLDISESLDDLQADAAGRLWVCTDHEVRLHALPGLERLATWRNDKASAEAGMTVQHLAPGPAGCLLGRRDGHVLALDDAATTVARASVFRTLVTAIVCQRAGHVGIAGSQTGALAALALPGLAVVWQHDDAHAAEITSVGVSDAGLIASASEDRTVKLWTPAGEPILTLRFHAPVQTLLLSADGRDLYVYVAGDRAIRRWRLDRLAAGLHASGLDPGFALSE